MALVLSGRARETAMEIPVDDLNKDTGIATLFAKLDSLFLKEEKDRIYEAYTEFDRIVKDGNVSTWTTLLISNSGIHECASIKWSYPMQF